MAGVSLESAEGNQAEHQGKRQRWALLLVRKSQEIALVPAHRVQPRCNTCGVQESGHPANLSSHQHQSLGYFLPLSLSQWLRADIGGH